MTKIPAPSMIRRLGAGSLIALAEQLGIEGHEKMLKNELADACITAAHGAPTAPTPGEKATRMPKGSKPVPSPKAKRQAEIAGAKATLAARKAALSPAPVEARTAADYAAADALTDALTAPPAKATTAKTGRHAKTIGQLRLPDAPAGSVAALVRAATADLTLAAVAARLACPKVRAYDLVWHGRRPELLPAVRVEFLGHLTVDEWAATTAALATTRRSTPSTRPSRSALEAALRAVVTADLEGVDLAPALSAARALLG